MAISLSPSSPVRLLRCRCCCQCSGDSGKESGSFRTRTNSGPRRFAPRTCDKVLLGSCKLSPLHMKQTAFIAFCVLTSLFAPLRSAQAQAPPADGEARIIAGRLPDRIVKGKAGPVPRLPGGKPDLGNGKGSWNPR